MLLSMVNKTPSPRQPGKRLSEEEKNWFYRQVRVGKNPYEVGKELGVSRTTSRRLMKNAGERYQDPLSAVQVEYSPAQIAAKLASGEGDVTSFPDPILSKEMLPNQQAAQAWDEFGYFRRRYFNRRHIPWQLEMVQTLMAWWESGQEIAGTEGSEVIKGIVNTPPGGGKTTTVTHDFPAWVTARRRHTRTALGSRTTPQSTRYTRRLRATFERNTLLNIEFGRFKPIIPEIWRADQFIIDGVIGQVASLEYKLALAGLNPDNPEVYKRLEDPEDDLHSILASLEDVFLTGEKEPTITALSQEMGFLGGRFDLNLWDDLVDRKNSKTVELRDGLAEWWFAEGETRCEPGGIVALIGTRFGKYDLFKHCKDLTYTTDDDVDEKLLDEAHAGMTEEELVQIRQDIEKEMVDKHGYDYSDLSTPSDEGLRRSRKVYRYYSFPAHDEAKCEHPHSLRNTDHIACVLDPRRFSYRHLIKAQAADPKKYEITYQQNDESTEANLVQPLWLTGGTDERGMIYPGCYDYDRKILEIPPDLNPANCFSIATVDPAAGNFWSVQWWIYDRANDTDYLINLLRTRLTAGSFIDYNPKDRTYSGVMDQWQKASILSGWAINLWIIEQAGAQRFLFQNTWVMDWMKMYRVHIKGHETHRNKADAALGVETLAGRYMHGAVSLPYSQEDMRTRVTVNEFSKELMEWPDGPTEDMVMGHWFLHFNRPQLAGSMVVAASGQKTQHPYRDSMTDELISERGGRVSTPDQHPGMGHAARRALLGRGRR